MLTAALLVAVASGLFLAYPFSESAPFVSTVGIENVVPFGDFWRRVHYFSAWLVLLSLLYHAVEALLARAYLRRTPLSWLGLTLSLPLLFILAFTGYITRWDETGRLAGYIAESLTLKIPLAGKTLDALLFMVREDGVHRAYLFHIYGSLGLLLGMGVWHFRLRRLPLSELLLALVLCCGAALVIPVGLHAPGTYLLVKGPWFFVGIQEALRHLRPEVAGLLFPLAGPVFYLVVVFPRVRRAALLGLTLWGLLYGGLTLWGLWR
ncbi:cytochrome b N-terminal domain-containing protein [Thermosulfurimonas sp. F29]|uniref:cytochrome b N-terminal domain-containing protein n=1 Tax=Thermosulfurimonas sp. F29 TaxID=2867247 RepID=UPI001C8358A0|nr:cytochrome b N-terminal domain-containing protein [Thermosulfurimonas sp. F29]MBX6422416.1 cytochrome b N-terminal domain-containing protein [Thermosulfurimonas sp. F29]